MTDKWKYVWSEKSLKVEVKITITLLRKTMKEKLITSVGICKKKELYIITCVAQCGVKFVTKPNTM